MNLETLWNELEPYPETIEELKKDISEGKVPNLPYAVIDQNTAKQAILDKIKHIKGERMQTNLIIADYGNGKTNLLKYLQLYFDKTDENIKVIYSPANVEQPDIILFLLKSIQFHYTDILVDCIEKLKSEKVQPKIFTNNFVDNFSAIKDFAETLFNNNFNKDELKKLIYLGTGRLYTIGHFASFGLEQLSNFNRREILVLFLNILAHEGIYIIFAIDEIELIQEKSKLRFNQFLTSYRELIDLFNKIRGHYIISCFTDASGPTKFQEANPAFYTRVKNDIQFLQPLNSTDDIKSLLKVLTKLYELNYTDSDIAKISRTVVNKAFLSNRELLRFTVNLLVNHNESKSVDLMIDEAGLTKIYNETEEKLYLDGYNKNLQQRFFDPLEFFIESNPFSVAGDKIVRSSNIFEERSKNKLHYFVFNRNLDFLDLNKNLNDLSKKYRYEIIVYSPIKLEFKNSDIDVIDKSINIEIVDYDPWKLFILLNIFRNNFEKQEQIREIISSYTENNL